MKLIRFRIKNVKSIIDSGNCYLSDDNITILAGQNEAGKTAVLQALDYFSNGMSEDFEKYALRDDTDPYVECEFELTIDDIIKLKEIDDLFPTIVDGIQKFVFWRMGENDGFTFNDQMREQARYVIDTSVVIHNRFCHEMNEDAPGIPEDAIKDELETMKQELEKLVMTELLKLIPKFLYYDSFKDLLPDYIEVANIPNSRAVRDLERVLGIEFSDVIGIGKRKRKNRLDSAFQSKTIDFNDYWSQQLSSEENSPYKFTWEIDGNEIQFYISRGESDSLYLAQKSQGFRWFHSFYLRLKAHHIEYNNKDYILLIDEPGQGLHETAQADVKRVIEDLALQGMQTVYSTHNPMLIDVDEKISRLRLVYQNDGEGSKIGTMSQYASGNHQTLDALSPIVTAMGMVRFELLNDNLNVVLEGITDKFYMEAFKILLNRDSLYNFIPATGADKIKHIVSILLGWGHDFKIIHDKKPTVYKVLKKSFFPHIEQDIIDKQVNHLDVKGIEDLFSKEDFKKYVCLNGDFDEGKNNSDNAKAMKKEVMARIFLGKVRSTDNGLNRSDFEPETIENFTGLFDWLDAG